MGRYPAEGGKDLLGPLAGEIKVKCVGTQIDFPGPLRSSSLGKPHLFEDPRFEPGNEHAPTGERGEVQHPSHAVIIPEEKLESRLRS
jgi:hypothetical protein